MIHRLPARARPCRATAVALVAMLCIVSLAGAAPGSLDPTFDGDGIVTTAIGSSHDIAQAVAVQANGKIVAAGGTIINFSYDFALARYNTDGSLDASFGNGGLVITAVASGNDQADAVALQADGKIVTAGYAYNGSISYFALARYNTDGSLDTSFDTDGIVTTAITSGNSFARGVAVQADGKIVAVGYAYNGSISYFALARYNTDGSLDTSFGSSGVAITAISNRQDQATAVALQADGKVVVAGAAYNGSISYFALVRYNTDGSLDASFDGDGIVTTVICSRQNNAYAVDLQADGRIVAVGIASDSGSLSVAALTRYNTDGSLDTSFDTDGKVTTAIGSSWSIFRGVTLQADGKIVAAGSANTGSQDDTIVTRYNADGSLDTSFGSGGTVFNAFSSSRDWVSAVALQTNGKIVAAGEAHTGSNEDFILTRYEVAAISSATIADGSSATLQNVTITNRSGTACTFTTTKYPVPPGGAPADEGELPIHWDLSTDCTTYNFDLVFGYTDVELANGKNVVEGDLRAYRSTDGIYTLVTSTVNTGANAVTALGVTQLSRWALASNMPLAVDLASFTATATGDGVVLAWETVSENDLLGFNLYRMEAPGAAAVKLNDALIPAQAPGTGEGRMYAWVDATAEPGVAYWYAPEDIALDGTATRHAAVAVEVGPGEPNAVGLAAFGAAALGPSPAGLAALAVLALATVARLRQRR